MKITELDKSELNLPSQKEGVYLSHCGISPLHPAAASAARRWDDAQMRLGIGVFRALPDPTAEVHQAAGQLLGVPAGDISFVRNTAEGLSLVANGLPLQPGDGILSYIHEYPSNHYPWRLQESRGAILELLPDRAANSGLPEGRPRGFELEDLERSLKGGRVKVVAVSHVQFTSGFTADLPAIGKLCREHGAWLVVDAAQSLGVTPLHPKELGVDALAASGWKWLLGPIGTGILYTSERLRAEVHCTMAGADLMERREDYLNHTWRPHKDGRFFEYGTASMAPAAALAAVLREVPLKHGIDVIAAEAARLRGLLLAGLDAAFFRPAIFPGGAVSILSWLVEAPEAIARFAAQNGVTVVPRGGYLRTAPHFYNTDEEIERAIVVLNRAARENKTQK